MALKTEITNEERKKTATQRVLPWVIPMQCEGCADCVNSCPVHGLEMWETENHGVFIPWLSNPDACIGCGKCEKACTWGAVSLTSYVKEARLRFLTKRPHGLTIADEKRKFNIREAASRKVAIVTCMECRLSLENVLQHNLANATIIQSIGPIIDAAELRSLHLAFMLSSIKEVLLIGHRDCRARETLPQSSGEGKNNLQPEGDFEIKKIRLLKSLRNPEANLVKQAKIIRQSKLLPEEIPVSGIMYEEFTNNIFKIF